MTDARIWIGDQGPFEADVTFGTLERIEDEEHENWKEAGDDEWMAYFNRVKEVGTAQFAVSCSPEHAEHGFVGCECSDCWGVTQMWVDRHQVDLLISTAALQRIEAIGVAASYRETILRQHNRRRLTEERSRR